MICFFDTSAMVNLFHIEKGFVKAGKFKNSKNRSAYAYCLTPKGIREKTHNTSAFLRQKLRELEALKAEIEQLRTETDESTP